MITEEKSFTELNEELEALNQRMAELENIEVQRVTEEYERFDALQVLDEYAKQLEESRDKLTRLFRAGTEVQESKGIQEALKKIAKAVCEAGWASCSVNLFEDWDVTLSAYEGCSDEEIEFIESHRRPKQERQQRFSKEFDRYRISRSYFIPAERLSEVIPPDSVHPGSRVSQPGDDWNPLDLAYVPLLGSNGEIIGSINCDDPIDGRRPTPEKFLYLELFADLASRKVENANLIEQQRKAEEVLRESEGRFRLLANTAPVMIWMTDADKQYEYFNTTWLEYTGRTLESEKEVDWTEDIHHDDKEKSIEIYNKAFEACSDYSIEYRFRDRNNEYHWVLEKGIPRYLPDGTFAGYIGCCLDVNEIKKAENDLREKEEKYRLLVNNLGEGVGIVDVNETFLFANPSADRIFGVEQGALVGKSISDFLESDQQDVVRSETQKRLQGIKTKYELTIKRQNGERRNLVVTATPENNQGKTNNILGVFRDVTEAKVLESQLFQSQKMEALGTLTGGIAHDFNNLLTAVMGSLELAGLHLDSSSPYRSYLQSAANAVDRAAALARRLLSFSRKTQRKLQIADLHSVCSETIHIIRQAVNKQIEMTVVSSPDLGSVLADPIQMEQIIMNLCLNAADAINESIRLDNTTQSKKYEIKIVTENVSFQNDELVLQNTSVNKGDYIKLSVKDNGMGMDDDTKKHILEPFFTTKEIGKGTGLGLSTVNSIVNQHNGLITFDSVLGQGTVFEIYLPRVEDSHSAVPAKSDIDVILHGSETIMMVDDEEVIRTVGKKILEHYGYHVLLASDGEEAMQTFKEHCNEIQVVILDLSMPGMSGEEVYAELKKYSSDLKIIISSGYDLIGNKFNTDDVSFAPKPFRSHELIKLVRDALQK